MSFSVVPTRPALSYVDDGGPENMNVPYPSWIALYKTNNGGTTYYVDPNFGSDGNPGTSLASAKATVFGASGAQAAAANGDTINVVALLQDAILPEGAASLSKSVTLQAYNGNLSRVILEGRDDISGFTWVQDSPTLWHTSVTSPARYALNTEWTNLRTDGANGSCLHDDNCVYALPLTINGQIMLGCGSTGAVDTTHAFHDYTNHFIYVGQNPAGKTIKMPMRQYAFSVSAAATVRGIVVRCYAAEYGGTAAAVKTGAGAWVISNCIVGFSASDNVNVLGSATAGTIEHCHAVYGLTGFSMQSGVTGHTYYNCYSYNNNVKWKYGPAWHGGGFKCAGVSNVVGTWCWAEGNYSCGFWRDFSNSANVWRRCVALNNTEQGFLDEHTTASDNTTNANVIAGCIAQGNWGGIHLTGATNTVMYHNSIVNNGIGLRLINDSRPAGAVVYNQGLIFENNLFSVTLGNTVVPGTAPVRHVFAQNNSPETGNFTTGFASFKNTLFHRDPGVAMATEISWTVNVSSPTGYASRAAWLAGLGSGLDSGGSEDATTKGSPYLTNPQLCDWSLPPTRAVTGKTIPTAIRDHLGSWGGTADTAAIAVGAPIHNGGRGARFSLWANFTGTDSALTVGPATSGQNPTALVGTHGISGNKYYDAADADGDLITWPVPLHDLVIGATIEGTVNSGSAIRVQRITFRHLAGLEATTFLAAYLHDGVLYLQKNDGGVVSVLGTSGAVTTANGTQYDVQVVASGALVSIYLNDVLAVGPVALSGSDLKYLGGTLVGLWTSKVGAPGVIARVDNLVVSVP